MDDTRKSEIISVLSKRIQNFECPMCHHRHFEVLDGYFSDILQADYQNVVIGGQTIPSIVLVCTNCGFISKHALGALGLMEKNNK